MFSKAKSYKLAVQNWGAASNCGDDEWGPLLLMGMIGVRDAE
ncbi:MAG: hypothetical protein QW348_07350 [Ignisphaera sp.]